MGRTLTADLRYAVRVLFRAPSFAVAVITVLALGIGANTAIFSIVNTVLLKPLPFEQPDRLVRIFHVPPESAFPGIRRFSVSAANYYDWKREARSFEAMSLYRFREFALRGADGAEPVVAAAVTSGFFDAVGTRPAIGRGFLPEEDAPGRGRVAILSDGFWKRRFGGARDAVGRTLTLNGDTYTVVGVMPAGFSIKAWAAAGQDLWVPVAYTDAERAVRDNHNAQVIARLRPGVTIGQAQAEMDAISSRLEAAYPQANAGWGATVVSLRELIIGDVRLPLLVLLAAVGLVLLIACANVANLLFARALARRKELAIRAALGAGRMRVVQQLLVEAILLSCASGAVALLLASTVLRTSAALLANQIPRADELSLDPAVLAFAFGISIVTGVLAGVVPALRAGGTDLNEALKEGGRTEGAVGLRTRRALIVGEVALSVVLLMSAGVMLRTLVALRHVDAGFDPHNVLTMRVSVPDTRYKNGAEFVAFLNRTLERVRALPGMETAGAIDDLPIQGGSVQPIVLEGHAELLPKDQPTVEVRKISPGYLRTMKIPLFRGRDVAEGDDDVILVSRAAAKLVWGDADPIGTRVRLPLESKHSERMRQVIGIVGDVKQGDLAEPISPTVYEVTHEFPSWGSISFVMRTAVPPLTVAQAAVAAVHSIDPQLPVQDVKTMDAVRDETITSQRFSALLLGMFAALALVLALVGIYSVLSYIVRGRLREIGIRTALGAATMDVVRLVVVEGMGPALAGIAIGTAAALAASRLLAKMVFGVSASDPATLAAVGAALAVVALAASAVPAYRAARVDPLTVFRAS